MTKKTGFLSQILSLDDRFWIMNGIEMFERLAYYGVRAVIALYLVLPKEMGGPQLNHMEKGTIFLWWAGFQSILPMITGGYADRYGYKKTLALAFTVNIIGYTMMAFSLSFWSLFISCMLVATGTAIFKPGVQGTIASSLKSGNNASVGWGVFYQIVNIGGFLGPVVAGVLRLVAWKYVFIASAVFTAVNFVWLPFFDDPSAEHRKDPSKLASPLMVLVNAVKGIFRPRVFFFCIVFSGFWLMFNQVFDLLPNVIDDWVDSSDIIRFVGNSFSVPGIPALVTFLVALIAGGLVFLLNFLGFRPDRKQIENVETPVYVFTSISSLISFYFIFQYFTPTGLALGLGLLASLITMFVCKKMKVKAYAIAISMGILAFFASMPMIYGEVAQTSQKLISFANSGGQVNPEWMINLNPGLIVFTMVFFGYLTSFVRPMTSILIGMGVATLGSLVAGSATVGLVCIGGIFIFSVGEMLSSPKKMEYLASLAPKGQEGLYMGYVNIPVAIGWMVGSKIAGNRYEVGGDKINLAKDYLLTKLNMAKEQVEALQRSEVMDVLSQKLNMTALEARDILFQHYHPEKLWYTIAGIGLASIIAMFIYDRVVHYLNKKQEIQS